MLPCIASSTDHNHLRRPLGDGLLQPRRRYGPAVKCDARQNRTFSHVLHCMIIMFDGGEGGI